MFGLKSKTFKKKRQPRARRFELSEIVPVNTSVDGRCVTEYILLGFNTSFKKSRFKCCAIVEHGIDRRVRSEQVTYLPRTLQSAMDCTP